MNILCIGDVVGKAGRKALTELLPQLQEEYALDAIIANAENSAGGSGITPRIANQFFRLGCTVITLGDHVWDRQELVEYLKERKAILRPANYPSGTPGKGWCVVETANGSKIGVINLLGRVFMRYNVNCPFKTAEDVIKEIKKVTNIIVVDMHAETTSEKVAMGWFLDGKASAIFGTHTHIQTADEKVLPKGTAYITDVGMTGPYDSVIGQNKEKIIKRFLTSMPTRFEVAKENPVVHGVVVEIDDITGLAKKISRVQRSLL
ncbi:MAG: TIGR00282 family metallophosphoesterase [Candidatus Omnitrophica bacterium]|nr:TIGR00282 family metallophosphoesterase [Candidatus Omnitrophota bacterium]